MIIISSSIPKSASTLVYNYQKDLLALANQNNAVAQEEFKKYSNYGFLRRTDFNLKMFSIVIFANFDFQGGTGNYNIIIDAFDENDGSAEIKISQNEQQIGFFDLDRDLRSNMANNSTDVSLEIKDVFVSAGDNFQITGIENGNSQTADHARIDSIEFVSTEASDVGLSD